MTSMVLHGNCRRGAFCEAFRFEFSRCDIEGIKRPFNQKATGCSFRGPPHQGMICQYEDAALLPSEYQPAYLSLETRDDVIVATFTVTELNDDENLEQLGHELFVLIDQFGCRKLVVDLGKIEFISSSAVGKIIKLHRKLDRVHGQIGAVRARRHSRSGFADEQSIGLLQCGR